MKMKTNYYIIANNVLRFSLAICLLSYVFHFVINIDNIDDILRRSHFPVFIIGSIIIIISGFGFELSRCLAFNKYVSQPLAYIAFLYTIIAGTIQFIINVAPAISSCHCVSFAESLLEVNDWGKIKFSISLILLSLSLIILNKHEKNDFTVNRD